MSLVHRFERNDEAGARRFWEVELDGTRMVTRQGKLGGLVDAKARELSFQEAPAGASPRLDKSKRVPPPPCRPQPRPWLDRWFHTL